MNFNEKIFLQNVQAKLCLNAYIDRYTHISLPFFSLLAYIGIFNASRRVFSEKIKNTFKNMNNVSFYACNFKLKFNLTLLIKLLQSVSKNG